MDEIVDQFKKSLNYEPEDEKKPSDFERLYKNCGKLHDQGERRREILNIQKSHRNDKLDNFRGILDVIRSSQNDNLFESNKVFYRPKIYVAGFHHASSNYRNVLMMSEWLVEKPEDFNDNWLVTPCPKGVRVLLVANKGITKFFSKYGQFMMECRTMLPGGGSSDSRRDHFCVLDGFYVDKNNTFYVLDLLAWNSQPMTDGETEFRNYWLRTQLQEVEGLYKISKKNKVIFQLLPMVPCSSESFNTFMMKYPQFESNFPLLDGLLFYHKHAQYVAGETPLVGWLFPFMVKEVLGSDIMVNSIYEAEKPSDYVNQADYIQKFEEKMSKKRNRSRRTSYNKMETESTHTLNNEIEEEKESNVTASDEVTKEHITEEMKS